MATAPEYFSAGFPKQKGTRMSPQSDDSQLSMFSAVDSPAKIYQWPANARAWLESGQGYGSSFYALLTSIARDGLSSRTCPAFFPAAAVLSAVKWSGTSEPTASGEAGTSKEKAPNTLERALRATQDTDYLRRIADVISQSSSPDWSNSGIASRGGFLTLNFTEWPNDAGVCSLSEVLETDVPQKFFLSPAACRGILRRAAKRGRELPPALRAALQNTAGEAPETTAAPTT